MSDDGLKLRPMTFEGIRYEDDWHVIWRGLSVGRILKQSGVAWGQPDWYWGIDFGQRPQGGDARGVGRDLEECKAKFTAAWERVQRGLSDEDIEEARRTEEAADRRAKLWAYRGRKS